MPLPDSIRDRIELFARNEEQYRDPSYKEAQLRQEFLDPFFAALGWDMENKAGHAEPYKDVIHEDAIKIGGETKAPDYSFRIGGNRKFFVEAKKPAVLIKDDPAPAYQLRRYSWSAKLPLGILTDFQEFAIYDTRIRPAVGDKAQVARIFYCTFRDYPEKWDELAGIFSKEAILRGSFDKYAASARGKRGTATVDDSFLEEIERWRDLLARHLALRNESLTQRDLNFVVQRLIDRLVFLRIAEDRGLEPFGQLQALTAGNRLYPRLCEIFERADYRYNSGLFHFEKDADCTESPDRLSLRLQLDDAPLKDVIKNLYYPASPYVFSVIPADILGSVYERFLGKVIHLTEGHRARIEEKPEVRKAGGVYYTPTYIVDYIVRQTVGTLVAGKSPKQIEKLRVLDPACGSGSFLLGAYQFLLDWYLDYYVRNDPAKWAKQKPARLYEPAPNAHGIGKGSGNWQLTTAERRRILLAHIHGVDIDAQAVEVTKLSLLLKVLEGEARETQGRTREMSAVLPDLGKNIRCGNSLVGHDFYAQPDLPELDDEARLQLNTFDWAEGFPEIMRAGGF
ncbi:MAG TPA: type I restriction endonuclease, partial [Opitutaceae bacterium]|nr:type I restriction endonuclease [Opitutaceae bacterium]